jgi:tRNA threonylcarbamoyl adenosine modification protein (Sua5/YciO/YrdC/YwlC family)
MKTQIFQLDRSNPDLLVISRAARVVEAGGLVIFPTETVYGIACRASKPAIARLDAIKHRMPQKSYSLHIAAKDDLRRYVPRMILPARKLVEKMWPGPLTIVFDLSAEDMDIQKRNLPAEAMCLYAGNSIGVRCPDDTVASAFLGETKCPVVAPSANMSGQPPAIDGAQAATQFDGQVDIVLDGGLCKYQKSSTVVRIWAKGLEMLREGFYTESDIRKAMEVRILFVCSGNTCRSPMAAGLCAKYLAKKLSCDVDHLGEMGYKISSAGTMAAPGAEASPWSVEFCASEGADISRHRSCRLDEEQIKNSDFIFAMSRQHCQRVAELWPEAAGKCELLYGDEEISDPIGGSKELYETCGRRIKAALQKRLGEQLI